MRKLNNQGWGLVMFLAFMTMFLFAILIIVYMVNDFSNNFNLESRGNVVSNEIKMYKKYENIVKKAAMVSADDNYDYYINIDDLNVADTIKNQCDGYVLFDSNSLSYVPYLKCNDYETFGFSSNNLR